MAISCIPWRCGTHVASLALDFSWANAAHGSLGFTRVPRTMGRSGFPAMFPVGYGGQRVCGAEPTATKSEAPWRTVDWAAWGAGDEK